MIVIVNDSVCAVILNSYQQKARVYNVTLIFQSGNEYCNFHLLMHLLSMNNIIFGKKKKKHPTIYKVFGLNFVKYTFSTRD